MELRHPTENLNVGVRFPTNGNALAVMFVRAVLVTENGIASLMPR